MQYIDAENLIYGRLSAYVAKALLNGEEVTIINSHKVAVTGSRSFIVQKFKERMEIGSVRKGPHYPRTPNQILRRSIGDMLPKKRTRGKEALGRCMVYTIRPTSMRDIKFETLESARNAKSTGFLTLAEISNELGYKVKE